MFRYNSVDTLPPFLDLARLREDHLPWHDFMISERDGILYLPLVINPRKQRTSRKTSRQMLLHCLIIR